MAELTIRGHEEANLRRTLPMIEHADTQDLKMMGGIELGMKVVDAIRI